MSKLLSLILDPLENASEHYEYKPLQRKVLWFLSLLFFSLAAAVLLMAKGKPLSAYIPVLVFGSVSLYGMIVGCFGSDRAVANLWNSSRSHNNRSKR